MRKILALLIAIQLVACAENPQQTEDNAGVEKLSTTVEEVNSIENEEAILQFENDTYEFGEIKEGEKVDHVFSFTNTGQSPLIISNVSASCGCTTPEYSKHPINPGEKGSITVVFDSNNQVGMQHKVITVTSNAAPSQSILHLKGEVK